MEPTCLLAILLVVGWLALVRAIAKPLDTGAR